MNADQAGAGVVAEERGRAEAGEADELGEPAAVDRRVLGQRLGPAGERGADDDDLGHLPAAEDDLGGLAGGEAEPLALELVGRPALALGDDRRVRVGHGVRERELADLGEQPAEERLLDEVAVHGAGERAGDDAVDEAAVPVEAEVEPGRDAAARQLVREREPERDDLERAHAEHHRGAAERGHLAATVVEGRVRDAQHAAGEHRIERERLRELADLGVGVLADAQDLERRRGEAGERALQVES